MRGPARDSLPYSARALAAARRAADRLQQAWAHQYAGWAHRLLGEHEPAGDHNTHAVALFDAAGDLPGMLQALLGHALDLRGTGHHEEALKVYRQALTRLDEVGDRVPPHIAAFTRVTALAGAGNSYRCLGRSQEAVDHLRASVELSRADGNVALESRNLQALGDVLLTAGRIAEAREVLTRCLALGPDADPERVAEARSRLARLGPDRH